MPYDAKVALFLRFPLIPNIDVRSSRYRPRKLGQQEPC